MQKVLKCCVLQYNIQNFSIFFAFLGSTKLQKCVENRKMLCFTIENYRFSVFFDFSDLQKKFLRTTWLPASCPQPSASAFQLPAYGFRLPASGVAAVPQPLASSLQPLASSLLPTVSGLRPPATVVCFHWNLSLTQPVLDFLVIVRLVHPGLMCSCLTQKSTSASKNALTFLVSFQSSQPSQRLPKRDPLPN